MATRQWLTPSEIAIELGVTDQCVRNWIHLRLLKGNRIGFGIGRLRVSRKNLDKFLADTEIQADPHIKEAVHD